MITDETPADKFILLHKENKMKEIEGNGSGTKKQQLSSYYDHGIKENNTLVIQRKPVTISIKLPEGSTIIREEDSDDNKVRVIGPNGDEPPMLQIKVNPDKDDFDMIRQCIYDYVSVPVQSTTVVVVKTSMMMVTTQRIKRNWMHLVQRNCQSPELNIVADCTRQLEPMKINIKTSSGNIIPLQVRLTDTVEDVKLKLVATNKFSIPFDKQRLTTVEDGTELGGSDDNEDSLGSDKSTLRV